MTASQAASASTQPGIQIDPRSALCDDPVRLRVAGVQPHQHVTLRAQMRDDAQQIWNSTTVFRADSRGVVDVSAQAPITGNYAGIDPMGIFWSMTPSRDGANPTMYVNLSLQPHSVSLSADVDGQTVAQASHERRFVGRDVVRKPLRHPVLVGTLFLPPGSGPFPAVISVPGSHGGLDERRAAMLATRGFAALALPYHNAEGLPSELVSIPLEYVDTAIHWLQAQEAIDAGRLAVTGASRGGELALLVGATFPQIRAVVAYMPSGFVHWGIYRHAMTAPASSWTRGGRPVPFFPYNPDHFRYLTEVTDEPVSLRLGYAANYDWAVREDPAGVERSAIAVERTNGPLLLITGTDDQGWPATPYGNLVMDRLARHRHPHPDAHVPYEGAGHYLRVPGLPTTLNHGRHTVRGNVFTYGGTPAANAHAEADSWTRMLAFLRAALSA